MTAASTCAPGGRQLGAIIASGDRTRKLAEIKAPTLVIHGTVDKMIRPSGGRATAKAIPGARLMMIEGMGHDLPRGVWPQIIDAVAEHARRRAARPPHLRAEGEAVATMAGGRTAAFYGEALRTDA